MWKEPAIRRYHEKYTKCCRNSPCGGITNTTTLLCATPDLIAGVSVTFKHWSEQSAHKRWVLLVWLADSVYKGELLVMLRSRSDCIAAFR